MRYLVVVESASSLEYWVAGSNATRSVAASEVSFPVLSEDLEAMEHVASEQGIPIPGIGARQGSTALEALDVAARRRSVEDLAVVLGALEDPDPLVREEAAMVLRSFESVLSMHRRLRRETEQRIVSTVAAESAIDTLVYLVEDLGYLGSPASIPLLAKILADNARPDHARWAAAIAVGRLQGAGVAAALMPGLSSTHEWTVAATLLGLTRRASNDNRVDLEPVLRGYVVDRCATDLLLRYACLGLSRFDELEQDTIDGLVGFWPKIAT